MQVRRRAAPALAGEVQHAGGQQDAQPDVRRCRRDVRLPHLSSARPRRRGAEAESLGQRLYHERLSRRGGYRYR